MSGKQTVRTDERGMVSFLVTLIMMAVITLIVVGFTQVASRNSREALDRQLSAQAFYAAESGVNVARDIIQTDIDSGAGLTEQTQCNDTHYPTAEIGPGVKYSCVLVDTKLESLVYNNLNQQDSIIIPLKSSLNFTDLNFSWTKRDASTPVGGCGTANKPAYYYPPAANWDCGFGILRVDLMKNVSLAGGPTDHSNDFWNNTNTLYLTPYGTPHNGQTTLGGSAMPFGSGSTKGYYGSGCNTAPATPCAGGACSTYCTVNVSVSGSNEYYARVTMLYNNAAALTVTGKTAGGVTATFSDAQTLIDVTGQAQDQLRRIQVRLAANNVPNSSNVPLNALTSTASICKRYSIMPTAGADTAQPADLCM